jgi:hypothetical protein
MFESLLEAGAVVESLEVWEFGGARREDVLLERVWVRSALKVGVMEVSRWDSGWMVFEQFGRGWEAGLLYLLLPLVWTQVQAQVQRLRRPIQSDQSSLEQPSLLRSFLLSMNWSE